MAKLREYNGRYCEADFENAFLSFLEAEGWQYLFGNSIPRASRRDVLYVDDLEQFLRKANPDLLAEEIRQIIDTIRPRCTRCMDGWWMAFSLCPRASRPAWWR